MNILSHISDPYYACQIIIRLFSVGLIISSLEYLKTSYMYSGNGVFSWKIFKLTPTILHSPLASDKVNFLFGASVMRILSGLRLFASCYLFCIPVSPLTVYLIGFIVFSSLFLSFRNLVGNDGSDQMNTITCIALFIVFLFKDKDVAIVSLYFIACQAILSYLIAGVAKLISYKWRNGIAIYQIMNTETYGHERIALYLHSAPRIINLAANWNIILIECLFPACILLPFPYLLCFIIWGILFHLYNAVLMGLNGFFWAFLATYPAIFFVNHDLHSRIF